MKTSLYRYMRLKRHETSTGLRRGWLWLVGPGLLLVMLAASSCNTARPPVSSAQPDPLVVRGQQVFERKGCFQSCHGAGALAAMDRGGPGIPSQPGPMPPDLTLSPARSDDWLRAYLTSPQALLPYSPMASYNDLSDADMKALIAYLQSVKVDPPPTEVRMVDASVIPALANDAANYRAGRSTYQTYCRGCHAQEGNGKGVIGQTLLPEPRDFTDAAWWSKQSAVYLFSVVSSGKPGTAMPQFTDILSPEQRAQVLDYVSYFSDPVAKQRMELPPRASPPAN